MADELLPPTQPDIEGQLNKKEKEDKRRGILLVLLFLLITIICVVCSSQGALFFIDRSKIADSMRSGQQADYGPDISISLAPIDRDRIIAEIISDKNDLISPGRTPLSGGIAVAVLPKFTPVIQPTPTILLITPTPTLSPTVEAATPTPEPPTPVPSPTTAPTPIPPTPVPPTPLPPPPTSPPPTIPPPTSPPPTSPPPTSPPPTSPPPTSPPSDDDDGGSSNIPPAVAADVATMAEDSPAISIAVLANDSDPDGTIIPSSLQIITGPANGAASINPATFEVVYTPNPNFNGTNVVTYRICDNGGACSVGTVTITVTPVNDPPIAVDDPFPNTNEDTPFSINVLANDIDLDGDPLVVLSTSTPMSGTITINPDNTVSYSPFTNINGVDLFSYVISDGLVTDTATVTVTINAINDPPLAVNDTASTAEDSSQLVLVLSNDSDLDGPFPLAVDQVGLAANGTVVIDPPGVRYTPNLNFSGDDTFTYRITDGFLTATAVVTMTVVPINDPPVAVDDNYTTTVNTVLSVVAPGVLTNDTDVDSGSLTAVLPPVTNPISGTLVLNTDGSFTYTPNPGFTGADNFSYRASDSLATSNIATVTITVTP